MRTEPFYEESLPPLEALGLRAIGASLPACEGKNRSTIYAEATIIDIVASTMMRLWRVVSMGRSSLGTEAPHSGYLTSADHHLSWTSNVFFVIVLGRGLGGFWHAGWAL
jgi:hypothetical protein